jgi:hypothetical protein
MDSHKNWKVLSGALINEGKIYNEYEYDYDMATIRRGEPGDILIGKAIIAVANPSGLHNIVNTQLGQPEGRGVSSLMLSAAKLLICLLAKRLPWLSLYE